MQNTYTPYWFDLFLRSIPEAQTQHEITFLRAACPSLITPECWICAVAVGAIPHCLPRLATRSSGSTEIAPQSL